MTKKTIRDQQDKRYRKLRDGLIQAEEALKDQRERVAELRRQLSPGTKLDGDYSFKEGPRDLSKNTESDFFETRLSELFDGDKDNLITQHLMFGPDWDNGCPMCSMWTDGFNGVADHLKNRVNFVVIARAPIAKLRHWGKARGWDRLRLLSSYDGTFNEDLGVELTLDRQLPGVSVFTRRNGEIRHFYTSEGSLVERHHRAMDLFVPVWNLFDLLPDGRGDWMPKHFYHS